MQLRLKKIIYDNINANKSIADISKVLNLPKEKVTQYYYSYKEHQEKQEKIKEIKNQNLIGGIQEKLNINPIVEPNVKPIITNNNVNNNVNKQNGGSRILMDSGSKINELEEQNRKMKLIIENHLLKKRISKILKHTDYQRYQELLKSLIKN
jgi:hypothetical protein